MAKVTIKGKGKEPITFEKGGLHRSLGVPEDEKIPAAKMKAALAGKYGPKAKQQAVMAKGLLAKGRRTAKKNAARAESGAVVLSGAYDEALGG